MNIYRGTEQEGKMTSLSTNKFRFGFLSYVKINTENTAVWSGQRTRANKHNNNHNKNPISSPKLRFYWKGIQQVLRHRVHVCSVLREILNPLQFYTTDNKHKHKHKHKHTHKTWIQNAFFFFKLCVQPEELRSLGHDLLSIFNEIL